MVSQLAKSTVESWQAKEGLEPTFEDIILLNALGLKLEKNDQSYNFSSVPRVAFLGDACFWEPTVAKRIWMDYASKLISDNFLTQATFTAYALNCPDNELPSLKDTKKLNEEIKRFYDDVLMPFSETQILAALEYALKGNLPTVDEDWYKTEEEASKTLEQIYNLPSELKSVAKQLLAEAMTYGIDEKAKYDVTVDELERMIAVAAMHSGIDVIKNEHAQNTAKFYAASGSIHKRLVEEKMKKENKDEK